MEDKKWVKITPTRTDPTGSGFYRAEDGRYLYGKPKNGCTDLTLEEQKKQRLAAEIQGKAEARRQRKLAERDAMRADAARAASGSDDSGLLTGLLSGVFGVAFGIPGR